MCVFKLPLFVAKALVQHVKHAGAVGEGCGDYHRLLIEKITHEQKTSTGSAVGDATRERVGSIADYRNVFQAS